MEFKVREWTRTLWRLTYIAVYAWVLPHLPLCMSCLCSGGLYYCHVHIFRQSLNFSSNFSKAQKADMSHHLPIKSIVREQLMLLSEFVSLSCSMSSRKDEVAGFTCLREPEETNASVDVPYVDEATAHPRDNVLSNVCCVDIPVLMGPSDLACNPR